MNGLKDDLASMMNDPTIPAHVTNRMLLAVLSEIYATISRMETQQREIELQMARRLDSLERRQIEADERIKELEENPSIVWLFRYRTKQAITASVMIFILLTFFVSNAPDVMWAWLGLPPPP